MPAVHYGDFPTSHTAVTMVFDSFAASTGASSATSNFASSDILVYRDGGTTQRTSANGITVSTSFDSQTGLQMVVIDLSDNTDAGFYAAGHEYQVGVADVTIDGQTVRFWLGTFSIERAGGVLALLKGNAVKVDVNTIKTQALTAAAGITFGTTVAATGDAMALTSGERNSVADALLNRDMSTGSDSGSTTVRTVRQALRFLRNKWVISAGTLSVKKEDDSTESWSASVTTTSGADPVTGSDPAGP